MAGDDLYQRIFDYPQSDVAALLFTDPSDVAKEAKSPEIAAWQLLLGSMQLRRAAQRSPSVEWLNHATHMKVDDEVFRAELLGEAGEGLLKDDRFQDSFKILNSALSAWRDVSGEAVKACKEVDHRPASEFAAHLLPMFTAARVKPPASLASIRIGTKAVPVVQQWLSERAVFGRAQVANTMIRLLSRSGQTDDARKILGDELEWVALNATEPAKPFDGDTLKNRLMSSPTRRALYLLLLARGEIELADGEFQKSADGFASAADLYEGMMQDRNDLNLWLQAKSNQANSLLRLHRVEETLKIYELCLHGFNSIGADDSAQRIEHAIVFAKSMLEDDDES